jgi:hypothetical protein
MCGQRDSPEEFALLLARFSTPECPFLDVSVV